MLEPRKLSDREKAKLSDFQQALLSESLQSKMINFAMSLTKCNKAISKDLIQQTYLKAMENENQFKGGNIDKWVITILKNLFKDSNKKGTYKSSSDRVNQRFSGDGITTVFSLIKNKYDASTAKVLVDSKNIAKNEYTLKDNTLTLLNPPKVGSNNVEIFISYLNRTKLVRNFDDDDNIPEPVLADESDAVLLERDKDRCLERLSSNEREVIALKQTDSYDEIADTLDMKTGTVRQIMSRAKEKFMRCMGFLDE